MKQIILATLLVVFLTGCTHSWFDIKYGEDLSQKEGFKEWIGREVETKNGELLIVHISKYDAKFIVVPSVQFYPTIEEYRKYGKTKKSLLSEMEILGIVPIGEQFTIQSIGMFQFNTMIGEQGVMLVKSPQNGTEYYFKDPGLFSIKGNSISLHDHYLEIVPTLDQAKPTEQEKKPAADSKK